MKFDLNYPYFGFPEAVNKPVFQVNLMSAASTTAVNVPESVSTLFLGIGAIIPAVAVQLSTHQQFPVNLVVNNPSTSSVNVTFNMFDADSNNVTIANVVVDTKKKVTLGIATSIIQNEIVIISKVIEESNDIDVTMPAIAQREQPGAPALTSVVEGDKITFSGKIAYFKAMPEWGRKSGNYVGVKLEYPQNANLSLSKAYLNGKPYSVQSIFVDGENKNQLEYFPMINYAGQKVPMSFQWVVNGQVYEQAIQIVIADNCTLAPESEAVVD